LFRPCGTKLARVPSSPTRISFRLAFLSKRWPLNAGWMNWSPLLKKPLHEARPGDDGLRQALRALGMTRGKSFKQSWEQTDCIDHRPLPFARKRPDARGAGNCVDGRPEKCNINMARNALTCGLLQSRRATGKRKTSERTRLKHLDRAAGTKRLNTCRTPQAARVCRDCSGLRAGPIPWPGISRTGLHLRNEFRLFAGWLQWHISAQLLRWPPVKELSQ
jgi:hypothetical protein